MNDVESNHLSISSYHDMDEFMNIPNIIMPGETLIRKAVSRLNNKNPGFFKNVKEIRVAPGGSGYAYVTNKPDSLGVIFLDFNRIKTEISSRMINQPKEALNEQIITSLAETIAHEVGHLDAKLEGGEFPAEQKARDVMRVMTACKVFNQLVKKL